MTKNILLKEKFFELWIALRYTQLKNKNHFISFISLTSIIGIALGVMALIVVLSVMNGFQSELKSRILNVASDVEIISPNAKIRDWQAIDKKINSYVEKLPVLEDDTIDIIEYVEQSNNKKKKKFNFWKLLETNE